MLLNNLNLKQIFEFFGMLVKWYSPYSLSQSL